MLNKAVTKVLSKALMLKGQCREKYMGLNIEWCEVGVSMDCLSFNLGEYCAGPSQTLNEGAQKLPVEA